MKRILLFGLIVVVQLGLFNGNANAEVTSVELQQFTNDTGLSEDELKEYLAVYDLSLNDFESVNELVSYLGEPVTETTLHTLLTKHNISEDELHNILGGFGESVNDYLFIKDLEVTVGFYINHAEVLVEAERMLSEIGLNETEIDGLFLHFLTLSDVNLEEKMKSINSNLEQYFSYNKTDSFTSEQQQELLMIYDQMISVFELKPRYFLLRDEVKQVVAYNELIEMNTLDGADLLVELYRTNEEYLLDLRVSEDMLASDFIIERGEKLITVATLANEMSISVYGNKLPDTASPHATLLLFGGLLTLLGIIIILFTRQRIV